MTTHVHFVGSIGLDTVDEVFAAIGETVKPYIKRCPDGEVGGRRLWVSYQYPVLRSTGFLQVVSDTAIPGLGFCTLKLRDGTKSEDIHFGELGYAREARISYQDFKAARERGVLPKEARFQVSLPTPLAVIGAFVNAPDVPRVLPEYERAMVREVERIAKAIPHRDLAIQWDVCVEMIQWDGRFPGLPPFPGMEAVFAGQFARLGAAVPQDVELGFHLCYGDMDAKHFVDPIDTTKIVELANLIMKNVGRAVQWIHLPVPINRDDEAYFAPLKDLKRGPATEIYLGLVHLKDGVDGARRRMQAARKVVKDFGIATECGIARARTPDMAREIMAIHAGAAQSS